MVHVSQRWESVHTRRLSKQPRYENGEQELILFPIKITGYIGGECCYIQKYKEMFATFLCMPAEYTNTR